MSSFPGMSPSPVEGFGLLHDRLQFNRTLSDEAHQQAAAWLDEHPDASLRFFGNYGHEVVDTEWLRHYPRLRGLTIDSVHGSEVDLAGLRHLPDELKKLTLALPGDEHSATLLRRCTGLRHLGIGRHRRIPDEVVGLEHLESLVLSGGDPAPLRTIEPLPDAPDLREVRLGSVTVPDLRPLVRYENLSKVAIYLGGTTHLDALADLPNLAELTIVMVRGLSDLSFLDQCTTLRSLRLEAIRNVTELPDLSPLSHLHHVELTTMKGLHDLTPVAAAPALETLDVFAAGHLTPEDLSRSSSTRRCAARASGSAASARTRPSVGSCPRSSRLRDTPPDACA